MNDKRKKIEERIITPSSSILDGLKHMDQHGVKLLLVIENGRLLGLLSIGDIQRAIIKTIPYETPIKDILRKEIIISSSNESSDEIKRKMLKYRLECMPVLDQLENLIDVFFWEDVFPVDLQRISDSISLPVVIMAGGKGTRLKPLTNIIPKPLIPIGEKPILEVIIDKFNLLGVKDFYLSVNYKQEMIKFYFDNVEHKPYNLTYFTEDQPLGTAGSLYLLKDKISTTFFVSNCDIIIEQDYREIYNYHKTNKNLITLVASIKNTKIPYGTVISGENGELVSLKEKPDITYMINSGMYILEPSVLSMIPENKFYNITDLIENVKRDGGKVGVFPVSEKSWLDIGEWAEYQKVLEYNGFKL